MKLIPREKGSKKDVLVLKSSFNMADKQYGLNGLKSPSSKSLESEQKSSDATRHIVQLMRWTTLLGYNTAKENEK